MSRHIALVDMEGTLSNSNHRKEYQYHPENHHEWHEGFVKDKPNHEVVQIVASMPWDYMILSCKPEQYREAYHAWIEEYNIPDPLHIYMRPLGNHDTSPGLKQKWVQDLIDRGYKPVLAIDDRADVCGMYRNLRIPTFYYKNQI